jgi:transcriptional regulator with XRE-family HTH domain
MPSGPQIRAARALLGISAAGLAERVGITLRTVQRFESEEGLPPNRENNLDRVKRVLEAEGIEFLGDPVHSPGVRLNRKIA